MYACTTIISRYSPKLGEGKVVTLCGHPFGLVISDYRGRHYILLGIVLLVLDLLTYAQVYNNMAGPVEYTVRAYRGGEGI